jgi:glycosyltransferase involved in cell wall biosynthesis
MRPTHVVFLSYDGMTDPLGQSQVIPYLAGLSKKGFKITIVSFEKKDRFGKFKETIQNLLNSYQISWKPLSYTPTPPVLSTLYDIWQMNQAVSQLHAQDPISILHCRSYITALIGQGFKLKKGISFLFDMRAFYADERVDGGLWNLKNPLFKFIYSYFKRKEIEFLNQADYSISLTNAGKKIIHSWKNLVKQPVPIEVIPCCADLAHFDFQRVKELDLLPFFQKLKLEPKSGPLSSTSEIIISYLGSLGTWYMEREMFAFFKQLKQNYPRAKFLLITMDERTEIIRKAEAAGLQEADLRIVFGTRAEVPYLISLSHFSLFFIQPLFSKQGSSPTKHGEILGMGIPVVCNAGVGDVAEIVESTQSGVLVHDFSEESFQRTIAQLPELIKQPKQHFRDAALAWYSLETGIERYFNVYSDIMTKRKANTGK